MTVLGKVDSIAQPQRTTTRRRDTMLCLDSRHDKAAGTDLLQPRVQLGPLKGIRGALSDAGL